MGRVSGITLYFDDRAENAEAGKRFGFQSVLVKTNHLEEHQEWQEISRIDNNKIKNEDFH